MVLIRIKTFFSPVWSDSVIKSDLVQSGLVKGIGLAVLSGEFTHRYLSKDDPDLHRSLT